MAGGWSSTAGSACRAFQNLRNSWEPRHSGRAPLFLPGPERLAGRPLPIPLREKGEQCGLHIVAEIAGLPNPSGWHCFDSHAGRSGAFRAFKLFRMHDLGAAMRSVAALLNDTVGIAPREGDGHVMIDKALGVTSIQRVGLESHDEELVLSVWPGELKPQALWLYAAGRAERLLEVAHEDGWQITPTPHLAFRTSWPRERVYLHPALEADAYVRQWSREDRHAIGGHPLADVPELWEWLRRRGYASAADTQADRDAFMARVRMEPVHLRPGLHLAKSWAHSDAERLDASGDFVAYMRGSLNLLLDALDESLIPVPSDEGAGTAGWSRVPLERTVRSSFRVRGTPEEHSASRIEALLVERYAASLAPDGVCRARIIVETGVLYSDMYNETRGQLVEAKATASRPSIRLAIGQLADYRRFIDPPPDCAVLLPTRPSQDLLALLAALGVAAIWQEDDAFADSADGRFT